MSKDLFEKPLAVKEAVKAQKGLNWALEILIFVAVFFVCQFGMAIVMMPVELVMLFTNHDYVQAALSGDIAAAVEASMGLAGSEIYTVVMLFADAIMILLTCLFCKLLQKRKMVTMGFCKKGMIKEYVIGLVAGFACFSLAVLLGVVTGALKIEGLNPNASIGMLVAFFIGFMIQGMAEEVICRGYFMVSYARKYPMYAAVIANALVFAALHLMNSGITVLSFINLTLFGVFASVYFIRRGNIWGIGAFHTIWNFVQGNFYGIRVSGMALDNSVFTTSLVEGKELLSGGAFGLEGSILVTIILTAGTILLFFLKKKPAAEAAAPEAAA